jgi:ABC-2 type transport system permease protein
MVRLLLGFWLGRIGKYYATRRLAKWIITGLFGLVFLFVAFGVYAFFVSGFRYINVETVDEIRFPLTLFIYEQFLVVLAGVIAFSSMISGLFNLFRGDTNTWIMSSPSFRFLPTVSLLRSLLSSVWPLLVVFLPAMLALDHIYHPGLIGFFLVILSIIPLTIVINVLTLLLIVGVAFLLFRVSRGGVLFRFTFKRLITLLLFIVSVGAVFIWKSIRSVDLVRLFRADNADAVISITSIGSHFRMFPTHPFALELISWQTGVPGEMLYNFALLLVLAAGLLLVWRFVSPSIYPMWQILQEGTRGGDLTTMSASRGRGYRFEGSLTSVLFKKEALVLSRNFKGVLWLAFLFTIWMLQVGMNVIVNSHVHRYEVDISQKLVTLQLLQYIIAVYFVSAFALRFVFPSFSVEKKTLWILGSAPLSFKRVFFGKYLFFVTFFVGLGMLMSFINVGILKLSLSHGISLIFLFLSTIVFIVTLGLSLGALYPSRETDDPEAISTSIPGLFFTGLSLVYGAFSDCILYLYLTKNMIAPLFGFIVVTMVIIGVFLAKVPRRVQKTALLGE